MKKYSPLLHSTHSYILLCIFLSLLPTKIIVKRCSYSVVLLDYLSNKSILMSDTQKNLISGGIAGSVGKTITAPLSRMTLLLQVGAVSSDVINSRGFDSVIRTWQCIYREEGIRAFWKGNLTSIIHRFPYSAINFSIYEVFRDAICQGKGHYLSRVA
jgi:hypothetical protein